MSLSASMWTGVSGLLAHGERMNVLGNNIANVNTVGFKSSRMYFEDFFNQEIATTAADNSQVGRGVSVAAVFGDFSQGALETTNEATDLAIGGEGFFCVRVPGEETVYYTRAGNFRFNLEGYLVDPHGYVVQGREIIEQQSTPPSGAVTTQAAATTNVGTGVPRDIYVPPEGIEANHTSHVDMMTNLENGALDHSVSATDPFFSMFQNWDYLTNPDGIGLTDNEYAYQNTIRVYDEAGASHDLTVYYDPVTMSNTGGVRYWEYMVTIDPAEDMRTINGQTMLGNSNAGIMMIGSLTFSSSGQLRDMTAYTLLSNAAGNLRNLNNWAPTQFRNGYPIFAANFTGYSNSNFVVPGLDTNLQGPHGQEAPPIEMNFGISSVTGAWTNATAASTAADIGLDPTQLPSYGVGDINYETLSTTSYASASTTQYQAQDGYTSGFLQSVSIDRNGILSGRFSNGVTRELWEISLALFQNETGLTRMGGNLFAQSMESGEPFTGPANTNGRGSIASSSLEQSNVDLAREFVDMIATQRGFSANGKVITTTDQMLAEVIMLKR